MKFANTQAVGMMLQAFATPRTVTDACIPTGLSMEVGLSAVRLLLFKRSITETVDKRGRHAYIKVIE